MLQVRTATVVLVCTRKGNSKSRMRCNFRSTAHNLGATALGGLVSIWGSFMSLGSLGSFVL